MPAESRDDLPATTRSRSALWFSEDRLVDYSDFATECGASSNGRTPRTPFLPSARPHQNVYKARVQHREYANHDMIVEGLSRSAVELVDAPYTRDSFLGNVFRHEIHVPDVPGGISPRRWRIC